MKPLTKSRSRFGTVLYIAMVFIALVNLLALAYVKAIPTEANSYLRSRRANTAHYVCEAGVNDALTFITFELKNGREPTPSGPITRTGTHMGWDWSATITPDAESPPIGPAALRFFEINCVAFQPNSTTPARRIRCTVGEETFARYTNYVDRFPSWIYYNLISGGPFIEGHVHTNTHFKMLPSDALYASNSGPTFKGYLTSAEAAAGQWGFDGVNYMEASQAPFDTNEVPNNDRYKKLYLGGREGFNTDVSRIEMPESSGGLARRAWGEDTTPPDTRGLHFTLDGGSIKGGYYVVGDVKSLLLEADGGTAKLTFIQVDPDNPTVEETTIIVEAQEGSSTLDGTGVPAGSTGIRFPDGTIQVYPGLHNGVFHTTGSIESLQGTNRGSRTISASLEDQESIFITDDILRADTPAGSRPTGSRDVLGLVTYQVVISSVVERSSSNPLYLYMSYLAGREESNPYGGLKVDDYSDTTRGRGSFYIYGSSGAGTIYATGNGSETGFGFRHYFDEHVVNKPPPYYPTTGKLPIRSWREEDRAL